MHPSLIALFLLLVSRVLLAAPSSSSTAPLPNATELLNRAIANERNLAAEQERYECRVTDVIVQTDSSGNPRKTTTVVKDQFYVNGVDIERTLQKNGRDLTPDQAKKEDARVMKETLKYSNPSAAQKEEDQQNQQAQDFMQVMMLTNGRRQQLNGRSILYYDIVPNPHFDARNLNQRMARVLAGTISLDEQSGEVMDLNVRSVADLKIGGGLLANLHKGFWFHLRNQPQPDGVWLTDLAEGSGDARAALFFHPYFRFKEVTDNCHLYSAKAIQVGPPQVVRPH